MKAATIVTSLTLGVVAFVASSVIASAQPDGIDPPAGPVADTQPSLTSLEAKIDSLALSANRFPGDLKSKYVNFGGNQTYTKVVFISDTEADFVRLYGALATSATANMLVGPSEERIISIGGCAPSATGDLRGHNSFDFGGLRVPTPVKFETGGQDSGSTITLLYWIEE